jgi:hypothetical protein
MERSGVQESGIVSVAIDGMATNPDRSDLAAKCSEYMFAYYVQPLARPKKCLPLHVFRDVLGKAGPDVQPILDDICKALFDRNIKV